MFQRIGRGWGMATVSRTGTSIYASTGKGPSSRDLALLQAPFAKQ